MSESEFLALEPRERDALVAEKVKGWTNIRWDAGTTWMRDCLDAWIGEPPEGEPYNNWPESLYEFTTDISAAWQVVGKMREEGWTGYVEWVPGFGFGAEFSRGDSNLPGPGFEWGDSPIMIPERTAPLAIAIAALKAKGVIE